MKAMTDAALVQAEPVKRFVPVFVILLILMLSPLANSLAPTCDVVFVVYFTSLAPHFLRLCLRLCLTNVLLSHETAEVGKCSVITQ